MMTQVAGPDMRAFIFLQEIIRYFLAVKVSDSVCFLRRRGGSISIERAVFAIMFIYKNLYFFC